MVVRQKEPEQTVNTDYSTRIMLVADDMLQGKLLGEILSADGFEVALADNEKQALGLYDSFKPDVIIIDVALRDKTDCEIAKKLQSLNPEVFVPIIFITSSDSVEQAMKYLEIGGVDCLAKPFNPALLGLKIHAYKGISQLHKTSNGQRDKLQVYAKRLESSQAVAESVFKKIMQSDVLESDGIRYFLSPNAVFNGDMLLAAYRPSGELHVMLGDFAGHDLSAAIGTIPVSDIFYGMTEKGFSISEIVQEINAKLYRILPRGLFLAACLVEYTPSTRKLSAVNAGLPDALIYNDSGDIRFRMDSRNFPLGINPEISVIQNMNIYELEEDDRVLMCTDGLLEAKNSAGEHYGTKRLESVIRRGAGDCRIEILKREFKSFVGDFEVVDAITIIELDLARLNNPINAKKIDVYPEPVANAEWKLRYCFGPDTLRQVDPLPNIVQTLIELQRLHRFKQDIFVILKELYVNAIDHGLLEMESSIKNSAQGFSRYAQEREQRLSELEKGIICIEVVHSPHPQGGILDVYVYDSGKGFDVARLREARAEGSVCCHGMGLLLLDKICESVEYNDAGNEVHARYIWRT